MYKSLCLVISFLLCSILALGQNNNPGLFTKADYPNPITPSPEASALGKYGETPVSLFSGLPEISVPIYDFKIGDISVPLNLSYNAGGIKVDDIATNVGLGWVLNAGGIISKTVQGSPDGTNNYEFPGNNFNPNYDGDVLRFPPADYVLGKILVEENKDLERDVYYYNFLKSSGKFVVNHSGKACFFPANPNIKVDLQENGNEIIITDDNGFKYFFGAGATEGSKSTPVCSIGIPGGGEYPDGVLSAYYLTKIVSPNNNIVRFEYEAYSYKILKSYNEVKFEKSGFSDCPEITSRDRVCNIVQEFFGQRLKRISSENDFRQIEFSYSAGKRQDLKFNNQDQGNYLEKIMLKNAGVSIKNWNLGYSYFGTGNNLRLKLLSVQEDGQGPWNFTYNEQYPLPERLSFSQDYWGYYNGKTASNTFIPPIPAIGRITGADRTPDFNYMASGSLTGIQYPTGGTTYFEYEPHQETITENTTTYVTESASLSNIANGSTDFLLPIGAAELKLNWSLPTLNADDFMTGYIFGGANLTTVYKMVTGSGTALNFPAGPPGSTSQLIPGSTYRLSISANNDSDRGELYLEWKRPLQASNTYNKIMFGGLRIKSINSYNGNQLTANKSYSYIAEDNPLKNNILLPESAADYQVFNSIYRSPRVINTGGRILIDGYCAYNIMTSNSVQSLGAALDNTIGYQQVTETDGIGFVNGRTVYKYLAGGIDGAKGMLLEKREQKFEGGLFKNVHILRNTYDMPIAGREIIPSMVIRYIQPEVIIGIAVDLRIVPAQFELQKYLAISGRLELKKTEDITFNNLTTDSTVAVSNYTYNNSAYTYPTRIENLDSRGKTIRTDIKYVADMLTSGSGTDTYSIMYSSNIIAPRIETNVVNATDNLQLTFKRVNYGKFINNYLPSSIETAYANASANTEITFNQYDVYGNLLTFTPIEKTSSSFQWGYNHQYPVAKCVNALANEFYFESFEESNRSGVTVSTITSPSHSGSHYLTGTYAASWQLPNSRVYVISYWYRRNGVWLFTSPINFSGYLDLTGGDAYDDVCIYPKDAAISTYTYEPLIGLTSETDPKGKTTYYEYDDFQRLRHVEDQKRNIIKTNTYHYKN